MINFSLYETMDRILKTRRIGKQDVQDLRRNCLADGLMSRAEAEILIDLDRQAETVHATWPTFFIGALTEFAVWGSRPTGTIDQDTAQWLTAALMGDRPSPRAPRVLREILAEAHESGELVVALMNERPAASGAPFAAAA